MSSALGTILLALAVPPGALPQDPVRDAGPDSGPDTAEIARIVDEYLSASGYRAEPKPWESVLDRMLLYADLRLRHESDFNLDGAPDRQRQRLRLRLGANYELNEQVTVGARLVTGDPDDARSNHITLGNGFDNLDMSLDRLFLGWHPDAVEGLLVTAGKFDHAFVRNPVYGELVWDADVQPEGVLAHYNLPVGGAVGHLLFTAGQYILIERSAASDSYATVLQLSGDAPLSENARGRASISYYHYSDQTGTGSSGLVEDNHGNAEVDLSGNGVPDAYVSNFGVLNPVVAVEFPVNNMPVSITAEYIKNLRANIDRDQGYALGIAAGSTQRKGDWRYYYQWQVVEQDSVFSPFAQDDFLLTTNHRSHVAGINYQLGDKIGLHVWGLVSSRDYTLPGESDAPMWRVRVDLDVKL